MYNYESEELSHETIITETDSDFNNFDFNINSFSNEEDNLIYIKKQQSTFLKVFLLKIDSVFKIE